MPARAGGPGRTASPMSKSGDLRGPESELGSTCCYLVRTFRSGMLRAPPLRVTQPPRRWVADCFFIDTPYVGIAIHKLVYS